VGWIYVEKTGTHVMEVSDHQGGNLNCPKCNLAVRNSHMTKTDMNGDEVVGWRYAHPCGAKLLIIND
jgi:hypothetical protein